ncbi:hypothetical protein [Streptomyces sp. NPDC048419]|uniref:hypothetical protein n=1 Tax=Streptomyces sp. NPDC048419 TaxID=3365547 RepID=UPI0037187849
MSESKQTSIKTSEEVRDRLKLLAKERGTTITGLLEQFANRELTQAEREARAQDAIAEVKEKWGAEVTEASRAKARAFIEKLQHGAAA